MHDGSVATLREVVEFYNRGGEKNPWLDAKIKPLNLTESEIDALVALMQALEGEGYQDTAGEFSPVDKAITDPGPALSAITSNRQRWGRQVDRG